MLLNSTPEGAREYLVPARVKQSSDGPTQPLFYALSQSPQQPKQLLVASGAVDRYFQLARCFRDEDGRKDRQPEFTQVDLEMAWVSWGNHPPSGAASQDPWRIGGHEVRDVVETIIRRIWRNIEDVELGERFPVMTYNEAMGRYGSDKPDLRFGLEVSVYCELVPSCRLNAPARYKMLRLDCPRLCALCWWPGERCSKSSSSRTILITNRSGIQRGRQSSLLASSASRSRRAPRPTG